MSDIDYTATDGNGETIDLRDLTTDQLDAYRLEAARAGDETAVVAIDAILASRF